MAELHANGTPLSKSASIIMASIMWLTYKNLS